MEEQMTKIEGEFKAMKAIVKSMTEHIENVTPEGRVWLRAKIDEILGDEK
jgi:hypothetical protein